MVVPGIKASELIELLQKAIKDHGDLEVWVSSKDCPEGIKTVYFQKARLAPYPAEAFVVG